ncbi:hypothetical protein WAF17_16585 [Bernardetia sp. ABR2-2B]|uniref:hypothetical protein n=1 Tax=Bernardetia sp. ABR2-2B TaxID=3127472 RepID=UPI0030D5E3CE
MKAFIIKNNPSEFSPPIKCGSANGYVIIEKSHFLHGYNCDEIQEIIPNLNVHGGINMSLSQDLFEYMYIESPYNVKQVFEEYEDGWIVGFDTMHLGDTPDKWTEEKVLEEAENLKKQLLEHKLPII